MKYIYIFAAFFLLTFWSSCLQEELPVDPPQPGPIVTKQIEIGYPYKYQLYYDCESNQVVKMNTKYDWDIAFESSEDGYHIVMNTARGVFANNLGLVSLSDNTSVENINWNWDAEHGNLDSTAIGDWRGKSDVYVLDLQYGPNGQHLGYKKIKIIHVNENEYNFTFANLDGSNIRQFSTLKNNNLNFVHFRFLDGGSIIHIEPDKTEWDLLFTNHYHKFSNLPYPFVLTMALTNKENNVMVAESNDGNFKDITLADTSYYQFTNHWDEIGYDLKIRNSQDNSFTIDTDKCFIIKTVAGYFYKIRFVDFYNNKGVKGYPKFEIQKL